MQTKLYRPDLVSEMVYHSQTAYIEKPHPPTPPLLHPTPLLPSGAPRDPLVCVCLLPPEYFNIPQPGLRRPEPVSTSRQALQNYHPFLYLRVPLSWHTGLPGILPGTLPAATPVTESTRREWITAQQKILFGREVAPAELRLLPATWPPPSTPTLAGLQPMEHTRYQQWYQRGAEAWPVWGGGTVLHTTARAGQPYIAASNAFYPIPADAALPSGPWITSEAAKRAAIQAVTAYQPDEAAQLGLCRLWFQQTRRLKRPVTELRMTQLYTTMLVTRGGVSPTHLVTGGRINRAALTQLTDAVTPEPAWEVTMLRAPEGEERWLAPFAGEYRIAYGVLCIAPDSTAAWQVLVDAQTAAILGRPLNVALHADVYNTSADAQSDTVNALSQSVEQISTAASALITFSGDADVVKGNIAFHAAQLLAYLVQGPPATLTQTPDTVALLTQFNARYETNVDNVLPVKTVLAATQAGAPLNLAFVPLANLGARLHFPALAAAGQTLQPNEGPLVRDPARDPEVIYHELTHALMYARNPAPFQQLSAEMAPFSRALLEGYATYLAHSFGAQLTPAGIASATEP